MYAASEEDSFGPSAEKISRELRDKQRAWYSSGLVDQVLAAAVLLGGVGVGCRAG